MIDVNPTHLETITRILAAHVPDCEVRAFGSRVTWTAKDYSDLDLAVVGSRVLDPDVLRRLREAFEESDLPFRVDVLDWHAVRAAFRQLIDKQYEVVQKGKQDSGGTASETAIEHDARWPVVSLAAVAIKIGSGATPRGGGDTYLPHRTRFALVRSQNVFDRRFDHDGLAFITDQQAEGLRGVALQPDDVLLNITGDGVTFGRACMVPKDILPACVNQHVSIIRVDPERADAGYVLAFLTHPDVKSYIESFNAGGSRRAITKGHIESFRLPLPSLREQHAIAHILGTLDDKIELNRRMNESLEAMARALFKSWFVDFDPVRAKAEGRDPGLPKPFADLFPDSFEESLSEEVPANWTRAGISEWAKVLSGGTPSKADAGLWDGDIPWISPKAMTDIHADEVQHHVSRRAIGNGSRLTPAGSTLVMVRGMGLHQHVRVSQARREVAFNQDVKALVPTQIEQSLLLFALLDAQQELLGRVESSGHGTGKLPSEVLLSYPITLPSLGVQEELATVFDSLNSRIAIARDQSRSLGALRDTLLPKLISGELRVPDAERLAARAGL